MDFSMEDLDNWFTYHPPSPEQVEIYTKIRNAGRAYALAALNVGHSKVSHRGALANAKAELETVINKNCPPSIERIEALRMAQQAFDFCNLGKTTLPAMYSLRAAIFWANASVACN